MSVLVAGVGTRPPARAHTGLRYLPPRKERSFKPRDSWVETGMEGVIDASTIVVHDLDLSNPEHAKRLIAPGRRVGVKIAQEREGRITNFSLVRVE
jgi:hypothetical protein